MPGGERWRLPAEWEAQSATLLAWPAAASAWSDEDRVAAEPEFRALLDAVLARQDVILLDHPAAPAEALPAHPHLHRLTIPYNDTWCRDYGPLTLVSGGARLALDLTFDGWGGKYPAQLDNAVNQALAGEPWFARFTFRQIHLELEGGALDTDGAGTLLVNWRCLETRMPGMTRATIEENLLSVLHAERVLGVDVPPLPGDDTDGHIDTIARFIDPRTIVYQSWDPIWTARLEEQLGRLPAGNGEPYRLVALPAPPAVYAPDGRPLPATYANFLFVNGAVLLPAYGDDKTDRAARDCLAAWLPDHQVISLPAAAILRGNGSLHCSAMNLPAPLG